MQLDNFSILLTDYLANSGVSQNRLAAHAEVPQSQISAWANGSGKRFGKNARKVLDVIENYRTSDQQPIPENVASAVREFCRGKQENAEILANMIRSLQPLIRRRS